MSASTFDPTEPTTFDRRTLLARAGVGGAGLFLGGLLAGCGGNDHHDHHNGNGGSGGSSQSDPSDVAVLNFALNLEYLEASYYTVGTGEFLLTDETDLNGDGTAGAPVNGRVADDLGAYRQYFREIAFDESNHVRALRAAIRSRGGTPIARPTIDLGAVNAAIRTATGDTNFDAFSSGANFLLGAFLLSDVGATAYMGGSQFLDNSVSKITAAQILAVEGYHVGSLRTLIGQAGLQGPSQQISNARDALDGSLENDQGAGAGTDPSDAGFPNIAPTFPTGSVAPGILPTAGLPVTGLGIPRAFSQVLAVVYNSSTIGTASGGLFPNGLNGGIKAVQSLP